MSAIARLSYKAAYKQVQLWQSHLSWIRPHYAVKCNDISQLLSWYKNWGIGFDCASPGEVRSVLSIGSEPTGIVYANPCKASDDIRFCQEKGVQTTVVDSVEEVEKLAKCEWKGNILVRLAVPDGQSRHRFSTKFGASLDILPSILHGIHEYELNFIGFSFHVGSECMNPSQYYTAIQMTADAKKLAESLGFQTRIVDVGGGFLWQELPFVAAAKEIQQARKHFFAYSNCEWIAEPGRFLAQPTISLQVPVIAVRRTSNGCSYTLNESIYGMFSCMPFDQQEPHFDSNVIRDDHEDCILFGRTCDSADVFGKFRLPKLQCGDTLLVKHMGAYTYVSGSRFNGFEMPKIEIVETDSSF